MKDSEPVRVMIVDDHPVVRFGLASILSSQPDMVVAAQAATGKEAVALSQRHKPDVVLMDLRLPGMSGVEAIVAIRKISPETRFVVLTTYEGDEDIHRALEAGAHAYLVKGSSHTDLLKAIRAVHEGRRFISPSASKSLAGRPPASELSAREREILEFIVKGKSNKEIADALGITEGTVKWHVNLILSRLSVSDRTQAAVTALHRGIVHL
jgi:DNA-binding NarL/FixJ family response regulator